MNSKDKKTQEVGAKLKALGILFIELDGEMIYTSEQYTNALLQE